MGSGSAEMRALHIHGSEGGVRMAAEYERRGIGALGLVVQCLSSELLTRKTNLLELPPGSGMRKGTHNKLCLNLNVRTACKWMVGFLACMADACMLAVGD